MLTLEEVEKRLNGLNDRQYRLIKQVKLIRDWNSELSKAIETSFHEMATLTQEGLEKLDAQSKDNYKKIEGVVTALEAWTRRIERLENGTKKSG